MGDIKRILSIFCFALLSFGLNAQCTQTMDIHSYSASCNGSTSTVTVNFSVAFGVGDNSVSFDYDLGLGDGYVSIMVLEDDFGDMNNSTIIFNIPSCTYASLIMTAWAGPSRGGNRCSEPAPIIIQNVVPVIFGDIELSEIDGSVAVEWNTFSENNNDKFVIERSIDDYKFVTLGEIEAEGSSNREATYTFIDDSPLNAASFYRIKQVDFDGKYAYSDIRKIDRSRLQNISIYPNPANDIIHVDGGNSGSYSITDGLGQTVMQFVKGNSKKQLDIASFKAGVYYLQSNDKRIVDRFVKL